MEPHQKSHLPEGAVLLSYIPIYQFLLLLNAGCIEQLSARFLEPGSTLARSQQRLCQFAGKRTSPLPEDQPEPKKARCTSSDNAPSAADHGKPPQEPQAGASDACTAGAATPCAGKLLECIDDLYSVYKVEYYSLMEELRAAQQAAGALSHLPSGAGRVPSDAEGASPVVDAGSSIRSALRLSREQRNVSQAAANNAGGPAATAAGAALPDVQTAAVEDPSTSTGIPAAEAGADSVSKPSRAYGDHITGFGSDTEPEAFSDAEAVIVQHASRDQNQGSGPCAGERRTLPAAAQQQQMAIWKRRFAEKVDEVGRMEGIASSLSAAFKDSECTLACLCGRYGQYGIKQTSVTIGRSTDSKGQVDIDLGLQEPNCKKVRTPCHFVWEKTGFLAVV